jgi:hypothetical protein
LLACSTAMRRNHAVRNSVTLRRCAAWREQADMRELEGAVRAARTSPDRRPRPKAQTESPDRKSGHGSTRAETSSQLLVSTPRLNSSSRPFAHQIWAEPESKLGSHHQRTSDKALLSPTLVRCLLVYSRLHVCQGLSAEFRQNRPQSHLAEPQRRSR